MYKNPQDKLEYMKKYRKSVKGKEVASRYYQKNKDKIYNKYKEYRQAWALNNEDKIKKSRDNRKPRRSARYKERIKNDVKFKLQRILRDRIKSALKRGYKRGIAIRDLGCSIEKLILWLEMKFKEGMTWNNHGEWHIDHIQPLSSFDLTNPDGFKRACHFTNLQPLWAKENLSKGSKY